ncbi:MAG: cytochrome c biogenesis protein CcdA [Candidatus Nanohaloarchaea archaeon]|nr:cytochrome c biogenesis protein CcdA [Candidatus Nanohaloarchaea archaeon]
MVEAALPTLTAVIITAAVDSINPCAIGVMLLLVATLIKQGKQRDVLKVGIVYVTMVYLTYFVIGLGILFVFVTIPVKVANYITVFVSTLVIAGGILEIKDFFWYGKGTSLMIPEKYAEKISEKMEDVTVPGAILLGMLVAAVELPCTGGPYLAILTVIANQLSGAVTLATLGQLVVPLLLMAIYNLIFVMPLIAIVVFAYLGTYQVEDMKKWKHMNRPRMRLAAGLLMVSLGWILLILAVGIIRFG